MFNKRLRQSSLAQSHSHHESDHSGHNVHDGLTRNRLHMRSFSYLYQHVGVEPVARAGMSLPTEFRVYGPWHGVIGAVGQPAELSAVSRSPIWSHKW